MNNKENCRLVAAAGGVPVLFAMLDSPARGVPHLCAKTLRRMFSHGAGVAGTAGMIPRLVGMLRSPSVDVQEQAVSVLSALSRDGGRARAVVAAGALAPASALLAASSPIDVQEHAACLLGRIACKGGCRAEIVATAGAVPRVIALLRSRSTDVQAEALFALFSVCNSTNDVAIGAAGAIPPVVALLSSRVVRVHKTAVYACCSLSMTDENAAAVVAAGGIAPLLKLLRTLSCDVMRDVVARILCVLPTSDEEQGTAIAVAAVSAAGLAPLIEMLAFPGEARARVTLLRLLTTPETRALLRAKGAREAFGAILNAPKYAALREVLATVPEYLECGDSASYNLSSLLRRRPLQ